ncbi:MAG: type II secretion system F family protein [Candidatus Aenigmarchaeota archaeon]|nr:type II secretion system F family protein [Candidatus Aenigmarchaeota archaeon]
MRIELVYPKFYLKWTEKNLKYADMPIKLERFLKVSFFLSISSVILVALVLLAIFKLPLPLIMLSCIGTFLLIHLALDGTVIFIANKRAGFAEEVFPDMLSLIAANLRTGLTSEKALMLSARPEFGLLEKEIRIVAKKVAAGSPIEESMGEIGKRIKSQLLSKTFKLITEGIRKGGELAGLLEQTAEDIRHAKTLRKEISAQVTMYVIFIFLAAGIIAPLLFAISIHLVKTMIEISATMGIEKIVTVHGRTIGFMTFGMVGISPEFLEVYALSALLITSFFASFLLGLLKEGKEIAGLKFLPILFTLNFIIYFTGKILLEKFLVGFVPVVV